MVKIALCNRKQIQRIFDAARAFKWRRINCKAQRVRHLSSVKASVLLSEFHRARQQPRIELGRNEAIAKITQRTLRERCLLRTEAIENHLPSQIHHTQLHRFGVRHLGVCLQQANHCQQRRRNRFIPGTACSIHPFQLGLKTVIKQFCAVGAQEAEQLPRRSKALIDDRFLSGVRRARRPTRDTHAGKWITPGRVCRSLTISCQYYSDCNRIGVLAEWLMLSGTRHEAREAVHRIYYCLRPTQCVSV